MLFLIIPFRDDHPEQNRRAQLDEFLAYMRDYLADVPHRILIIVQSADGRLFNRGALLNAGFLRAIEMSRTETDLYIFHDVDLLPDEDLKEWYARIPEAGTVHHIAAVPGNRYLGGGFGGIVAFAAREFWATNGYPNSYWGWGAEDLALRKRVADMGFKVIEPARGTICDLEDLALHQKLAYLKGNNLKNPARKQWRALNEGWRHDGLTTSHVRVVSEKRETTVNTIVVEIMDTGR